MSEIVLAAGGALWLGVLTSISPCPLATNIAALSWVGRQIGRPGKALLAGLLYTLGRTVVYVVLAGLVTAALVSMGQASFSLQRIASAGLGPLLVVVGLVLLKVVSVPFSGGGAVERAGRLLGPGVWSAAPLGAVFALAFCPVSAALFFGSLIPLASRHGGAVLMPALYGIGTAVPVLAFAVILATGSAGLDPAWRGVQRIERWARPSTGLVFILAGLFEIARGILHIV